MRTIRLLPLPLLLLAGCDDRGGPTGPEGCRTVAPVGGLSVVGPDVYRFVTGGGGAIDIDLVARRELGDPITLTHSAYPGFRIDLWGVNGGRLSGNHESLNGKHIKDRFGVRRTLVFPGGARITMVADGLYEPLHTISLYDGGQSHRIDARCGVVHSSTVQARADARDAAEADGETGRFRFTETGLVFENLYTEDAPGVRVEEVVPLGELFRGSPGQVRDHFDDPRLGHT